MLASVRRLRLHRYRLAKDDADAARRQWRPPKVTAFLDEAKTDALAYMTFPTQRRTKLYSTNPIEHLNGEIKHRTDVAGIFLNENAIVRLVGAILLGQNDELDV